MHRRVIPVSNFSPQNKGRGTNYSLAVMARCQNTKQRGHGVLYRVSPVLCIHRLKTKQTTNSRHFQRGWRIYFLLSISMLLLYLYFYAGSIQTMTDQGLRQSSNCQRSAAPNNFQLTGNFSNAVLKFAAIAPEDFSP